MTNFEISYGGWVHLAGVDVESLQLRAIPKHTEAIVMSNSFLEDLTRCPNGVYATNTTATIDFVNVSQDSLWVGINSRRKNMIGKERNTEVIIKETDQTKIDDFYGLLLLMNESTAMASKPK